MSLTMNDMKMSREIARDEKDEHSRIRTVEIREKNEEFRRRYANDTKMSREMTREEKDEHSRIRMEEMREKNEELRRRYAEVEQDKKCAEEKNSSVTNIVRVTKSTSINEDEGKEIIKPIAEVHQREWDMHKTNDSEWEPTTKGWKSSFQRHPRNGPDRRFNKTKNYSDKQTTYSRPDQRYRNNYQSSGSKFRKEESYNSARQESDDTSLQQFKETTQNSTAFQQMKQDHNNSAFQQINDNQSYSRGRGRGRGFRPKTFEEKQHPISHTENDVRSPSFTPAPAIPPPYSHDVRLNPVSSNATKPTHRSWSSSSEDEGKNQSDFHKEKSAVIVNEKKKSENWSNNRPQIVSKKFSPVEHSVHSNVLRNVRPGSRFLPNSSNWRNQQPRQTDNANSTRSTVTFAQSNRRKEYLDDASYPQSKFEITISTSNDKRIVQKSSAEKSFNKNAKTLQGCRAPFSQQETKSSDGWGDLDESKSFKANGAVGSSCTWSDEEDTPENPWETSTGSAKQKPLESRDKVNSIQSTGTFSALKDSSVSGKRTGGGTWSEDEDTHVGALKKGGTCPEVNNTLVGAIKNDSRGCSDIQKPVVDEGIQNIDGWPELEAADKLKEDGIWSEVEQADDGWPVLEEPVDRLKNSDGIWDDISNLDKCKAVKNDVKISFQVAERDSCSMRKVELKKDTSDDVLKSSENKPYKNQTTHREKDNKEVISEGICISNASSSNFLVNDTPVDESCSKSVESHDESWDTVSDETGSDD